MEEKGESGKVEYADSSSMPYEVKFETADKDGYYTLWCYECDLELINNSEVNEKVNNDIDSNKVDNQYKFNIGDKVKVIEDIYTLRTNKIGIIIEDDESSCPYKVAFEASDLKDSDYNDYTEWFYEHNLELVENSSSTNNNQSLEDKIIELIKQERPNAKSIVVNVIITEQVVNISELNYSREF